MKNRKNFFLLLLMFTISCAVQYGCSGASPEYSGYQSLLKNQMQEMTNVLDAGHYNEFMSTYVDPSYIREEGGLDKALIEFGNTKQQQLYKDLKVAKNVTPLYNEKKKEMTYVSEILLRPITFKLINGKWMMEGDWFK